MPYGAEQAFDMLEQRDVRMNVQYSRCTFESALKPRVTARSGCSDRCHVSLVHM